MSRPADPTARSALAAAARAEFVKKGLRGARIEDITSACGLSKGAFYLHFESKEALFEELVRALGYAMESLHASRVQRLEEARDERGPLTPRDVAKRSPHYLRYLALESEFDFQALQMMWEHRDTMDVLIRGCAGTAFEGLVWTFLEEEVARVTADFQTMQASGAGRLDVEPELFAELAVGAYFLVGKRLSRLKQRPNLEAWAHTLQRLLHEGCLASAGTPAAQSKPGRLSRGSRPSAALSLARPQGGAKRRSAR
jgi:AcrR family transcriptional regulator